MWGPVISGVLFRLNGLGLWPNDPVRGRRHVRGQSTTVEAEMALQEELKVIYIYIYKTEAFEAPTIFHVSIIFK